MTKTRYRRNQSLCVLCQEETTYDWDHICRKCRDEWARGHAWAQAEEKRDALPQGMIEAYISWYWYFYHFAGQARRIGELINDPKRDIREMLLELVGAERAPGNPMVTSHGWAIGHPKDYRGNVSKSNYILRGDERTLDLLQKLYERICDLMAGAYEEGLRRGKSFVTDLVEGKLSVKDMEKF